MGAVREQTTGKIGWTSSPSNGSLPSLPAIGSSIIVVAFGAGASIDYSLCADNQGGSNTWARAVQSAAPDTNRTRAAVFYCANVVTAAGTFTITVTGTSGQGTWAGINYSGMITLASIFDVSTSNRGATSVNPDSGTTGTTAQADEVLAAAMCIRVTQSSITLTGWTQECETLDFSTDEPGEGDTKIISATGTQQAVWTVAATTGNGWAGVIATFKVSTGPTPSPSVIPSYLQFPKSLLQRST